MHSLQLDSTDRLSVKLPLAPTCLVNPPIPEGWVIIPEAHTAPGPTWWVVAGG